MSPRSAESVVARAPFGAVVALLREIDPDGAWSETRPEEAREICADLCRWAMIDGLMTEDEIRAALRR